MVKNKTNINYLWSELLIEELSRKGVECICISPGSRNSPISVEASRNKKIKTYMHYDERGMGFFALGLLSATRKPVVIVSTSGTAAANFLPSVIEASKKKLPLIILTADRPPELKFTGAHQSIDHQAKIFSSFTRWSFELPCPTKRIPASFVLTTIDQAVFTSTDKSLSGPVHLNVMFREPLDPHTENSSFTDYLKPIKKWITSNRPFTQHTSSTSAFSKPTLKPIAELLNQSTEGAILVGKISSEKERAAILKLSDHLNWPIFADLTSELNFGYQHPHILHHFNYLLNNKSFHPDTILQIGGRLTSKTLNTWIKSSQPCNYLMLLKHPLRHDPEHQVTHRLQGDYISFVQNIKNTVKPKTPKRFLSHLIKQNSHVKQIIDSYFDDKQPLNEISAVRYTTRYLSKDYVIFAGNSLPIRHLENYSDFDTPKRTIAANRGASGIDGNIATAIGFSLASNKPIAAFLGDLTMLHDINSLALLKYCKKPVTFIVLNNNGGGIFARLPIAKGKRNDFDFSRLFQTPHDLNFEGAAQFFGLSYRQPTDLLSLKEALTKTSHSIIEIITNTDQTLRSEESLSRNVAKALQ